MAEPTNKIYYCPIELACDRLGGKWKPLILSQLRDGYLGLAEIGRRIPLATRKMLVRQLRELERDGFVRRRELAELPPPIEYTLTPTGRRLMPVLEHLHELGSAFARDAGIVIHELCELEEAS